jgi:hypothetical protein
VNTRGQEFIKFTKGNIQHEKKQSIKTTNNVSYSYANASHISHMSYHDFDASYVLMRNKLGNHCLECWATPQEVKDLCVHAQVPCYSLERNQSNLGTKKQSLNVFCRLTPPVELVRC